MIGFLIFVMGVSTVWIMGRLYADIAHLQMCIDRVCREMDELRVEITEGAQSGKE